MKSLLAALAALFLTSGAAMPQADTARIEDRPLVTPALTLDDFRWVARPVVVFADSPNDPRFIRQMELLERRKDALFERDVVVITDTDPSARSDIRLQLRPRGFAIVLLAKDGQVALRKPQPWDVRELTRQIDKMPLREQEIRENKRKIAPNEEGTGPVTRIP